MLLDAAKHLQMRTNNLCLHSKVRFDAYYYEILLNAKDCTEYRKVRSNLEQIKYIVNELIGD